MKFVFFGKIIAGPAIVVYECLCVFGWRQQKSCKNMWKQCSVWLLFFSKMMLLTLWKNDQFLRSVKYCQCWVVRVGTNDIGCHWYFLLVVEVISRFLPLSTITIILLIEYPYKCHRKVTHSRNRVGRCFTLFCGAGWLVDSSSGDVCWYYSDSFSGIGSGSSRLVKYSRCWVWISGDSWFED